MRFHVKRMVKKMLTTSKTNKLGKHTGLTMEIEKNQTNRGRDVEWSVFIWFNKSHLLASGHAKTRSRATYIAQKKLRESIKENFEYLECS